MAPWADVVYACDRLWWDRYADEVRKTCSGERWTINRVAQNTHGVNWLRGEPGNGLPMGNIIRTGGNSGYQALSLAILWGAAKVILLGYDMQPTGGKLHWHANHNGKLHNPLPRKFKDWQMNFNQFAAISPVPIINCSRETALTCFPRMELDEGLSSAP